jgi:hypothetical protein
MDDQPITSVGKSDGKINKGYKTKDEWEQVFGGKLKENAWFLRLLQHSIDDTSPLELKKKISVYSLFLADWINKVGLTK